MNPDAGWYPVGLSLGLEPGTSTGTRLFGREIVVWRDRDGVAHCWEDRCPHRGMRLSFGFVRGNQIACLYHGWHYDAAGQCRYIPAHPQLTPPDSIRVETYACEERAGMVWTRIGAAQADGLPVDRQVVPLRSLYIDCAPDAAVARLAEVSLPAFASTGSAATHASAITPALRALANGRDELILGIQPIDTGETALHIAIVGGEAYRGAGQKHFNAWSEELRRGLEPRRPSGRSEYAVGAPE